MSIGARIKQLRNQEAISQDELAKKINVSRGNVGDWERERAKPGADALLSLSDYFKVSVDWILTGEHHRYARIYVKRSEELTELDCAQELQSKLSKLTENDKYKLQGYIEGLLSYYPEHK